jgi:eukaryotic-like serine/threonine-protein kinase
MTERASLAQIGKYPVVRTAIKVAFPESFHDPARGKVYRKLFLTEAKLAGKLQHPHICQIVMEYVDGGTVEKYCSCDALLSVEHTIEIIFKCTRAPANILHTGETDVKIADFGAALIASSMANVRLSGV